MENFISQSEFYMWRALFAMVHADDVVTDEEVRFMAEVLEDVNFSESQRDVLKQDIQTPQNALDMFNKIDDPKNQTRFFEFAHELVWVDGDYGQDEKDMMLDLVKQHTKSVNIDNLIGHVDLELDDDDPLPEPSQPRGGRKTSFIQAFRERFF